MLNFHATFSNLKKSMHPNDLCDVRPPVCCWQWVSPGSGGEPELDLQSGSSTGFVEPQRSLNNHQRQCLPQKLLQLYYLDELFILKDWVPIKNGNSSESNCLLDQPATPSSRTSPSSMRCTMGRTAAQMHAGKTAWGGCSMWWVGVCSVVFSSSVNCNTESLWKGGQYVDFIWQMRWPY